jgi:glutathione S-transferase
MLIHTASLRIVSVSTLQVPFLTRMLELHHIRWWASSPIVHVIKLLQVEEEIRIIELTKEKQRSKDYRAINVSGKLPILLDTETGFTMHESSAIMLFVIQRFDPNLTLWFGNLQADHSLMYRQAELLQWIAFGPASVYDVVDTLLSLTYRVDPLNRDQKRISELIDTWKSKIEPKLLSSLHDGRSFLLHTYSAADIMLTFPLACAYYLHTFQHCGLTIDDTIVSYIQRLLQNPIARDLYSFEEESNENIQ